MNKTSSPLLLLILLWLAACTAATETAVSTEVAVVDEGVGKTAVFPTNTPIPSATHTPIPTIAPTKTPTATPPPTTTPTLVPFSFPKTVVLSIVPDIEAEESTLWQWSMENQELQLLLRKEGVTFRQPLLSPTGRYLAYTHVTDDLTTSIWVLDVITGETKQWSQDFHFGYMELQGYLKPTSGIIIQSWYPNEQGLIFQFWEEQIAQDEPMWSYSLFEDGISQQVGSRILDITWSPEQPYQMAYLSQRRGVFLVNVRQPENSTQVIAEIDVESGSLSWHPDGQHIEIAGNLGGRDNWGNALLWNLDINTKKLTEIKNSESAAYFIRWSPNGQSLLLVANDKITLLGFKDDSFVESISFQLPPYKYASESPEYAWLPDNSYFGLLFKSSDWSIEDWCFYSILGELADCLLQTNNISTQLGLDETTIRIATTWSP